MSSLTQLQKHRFLRAVAISFFPIMHTYWRDSLPNEVFFLVLFISLIVIIWYLKRLSNSGVYNGTIHSIQLDPIPKDADGENSYRVYVMLPELKDRLKYIIVLPKECERYKIGSIMPFIVLDPNDKPFVIPYTIWEFPAAIIFNIALVLAAFILINI